MAALLTTFNMDPLSKRGILENDILGGGGLIKKAMLLEYQKQALI
jgi:hypothetical protein